MSDSRPSATPPVTLKRRQLARGAAWAAPVILATSAVPAYAASPCVERQVTVKWSELASGTDTLASSVEGISVARTTVSGLMLSPNFKVATNKQQQAFGISGNAAGASSTYREGNGFNVNWDKTSSVLVLNQASSSNTAHAVQTLTFTVPAKTTKFYITINDMTGGLTNYSPYKHYADAITVSGGTIESLSNVSGSKPDNHLVQEGTTKFHSRYDSTSSAYQSDTTKYTTAELTVALETVASNSTTKTFSLTYSNYLGDIGYSNSGLVNNGNYQYIALGDFTLTICY